MTKLRYNSLLEFGTLQKKLEYMAKKGWKLKELTNLTMVFEKIPPQTLHYAQVYLESSSVFDKNTGEKEQGYIALAEETGWEYVSKWGTMLIFVSAEESPTPLETDDSVTLSSIHCAMKKDALPYMYYMFPLFCVIWCQQLSQSFQNPISFYSTISVYMGILYPLIILCFALMMFRYFHWYQRGKRAISQGTQIPPPMSLPWLPPVMGGLVLLTIAILAVFVLDVDAVLLFPTALTAMVCIPLFSWLRVQDFPTEAKKGLYYGVSFLVVLISCGLVTRTLLSLPPVSQDDGVLEEYLHPLSTLATEHVEESYFLRHTKIREYVDEANSIHYGLYPTELDFVRNAVLQSLLTTADWDTTGGMLSIYHHEDIQVWEGTEEGEPMGMYYVIACGEMVVDISFYTETSSQEKREIIGEILGRSDYYM